MRKTLLIVAMLLLAAPLMATTTVKVNVNPAEQFTASDGNKVQPITISYVTDVNVRAFALDINIDNVNNSPNFQAIRQFKTGESNSISSGYGIFPSRFRDFIVVTGPNWVDPNYNPTVQYNEPGSTGTGMGYPKFIVEMGTLYAGDANKPAWTGTLFKVDVNAWGSVGTFHVTVAPDTLRGGVVGNDGNGIVVPALVLEGNDVFFASPCTTPTPEVGNAKAVAEAAWTGQGFTLCGTGVVNCAQVGNIITQDSGCYALPYCINYTYGIPPTVPGVVGLAEATATNNITAAGCALGTRTTGHSCSATPGNVTNQSPAGGTQTCTPVDYNVAVDCTVPNVLGQAEATATGNITAAGFCLGTRTTGCSGTYAVGQVMATTPGSGATPGCCTCVAYQVVVGTGAPAAPTSCTVPANDADGSYNVTWAASTGATSYQLESSAAGSGTTVYPLWVQVYNGTATTFAEKVGGGVWSYRVKATNACGSSGTTAGGNTCTVTECLKTTATGYADWQKFRYAQCWCFRRQCHGDIDGKKKLVGGYASSDDLAIFRTAYLLTPTQIAAVSCTVATTGNICGFCADLDHKNKLVGGRVSSDDLTIFRTYYLGADATVTCCDTAAPAADCTLVAGDPFNYWTN